MRISRLYTPAALTPSATVRLDEEAGHYLRSVLRLKKGYSLTVFNGDGNEYPAKVELAGREGVILNLGEVVLRDTESPLYTQLGLGISRGERMDFAIQKAVELGVNRITPLLTEHCVVRLDEDKKETRRLHWQKIVHSACEQCGRNRIPDIDEPLRLEDWIDQPTGLRLFFDPQATASLRDVEPTRDNRVTLLSGPEGGFAEKEREWVRQAGFTPIKLGPRILRTETAVLAALAAAQTLWGDWTE